MSTNNDDVIANKVKEYGKKNTGMINTFVEPVALQELYRVKWEKNKYSRALLRSNGRSAGNNYGLNYWINVSQNTDNAKSRQVVTQLPNSGAVFFARDKFCTDFLRTALWTQPLTFNPTQRIESSQGKEYTSVTDGLNQNTNSHRSYLQIAHDFGLPLSVVTSDDTSTSRVASSAKLANASSYHLWFGGNQKYLEDEVSKKWPAPHKKINDTYADYQNSSNKTIDSNDIFSSLLGTSNFVGFPKITSFVTANKDGIVSSSAENNWVNPLSQTAMSIRPPLYSYNYKLFDFNPDLVHQSSSFRMGSFGLILPDFRSSKQKNGAPSENNNLYLTFTYQMDLNNAITNVDGKGTDAQDAHSDHLIIDINRDAASQTQEITDIYQNLNPLEHYSTNDKLTFMNAIDGKSDIRKNKQFSNWNIKGRESYSLIQDNALSEPTVINENVGNHVTSDVYNKNDPGRDINTGYHPEKFTNFVLRQTWPLESQDINISDPSKINSVYCTKNRYQFYSGYKRDLTVKTKNPQYYNAPNYSTYDTLSQYETSFYFATHYIPSGNYWKIGDYLKSSQNYFFAQVNPIPLTTKEISKTQPMIAHFGSGINKVKIPLIWNSNLHFSTGGIVAITIVLVIIVGAFLLFRPWKKISVLSNKNIDAYLRKAESKRTEKTNEESELMKKKYNKEKQSRDNLLTPIVTKNNVDVVDTTIHEQTSDNSMLPSP